MSQFANPFDGVNARNLLGLHQVTSQHGTGSAMAMHTVNRHTLERNNECFLYRSDELKQLFNSGVLPSGSLSRTAQLLFYNLEHKAQHR